VGGVGGAGQAGGASSGSAGLAAGGTQSVGGSAGGGGVDPLFDATHLNVTGGTGAALCQLSPDWRHLLVTVTNQGTTKTGATTVRVFTDGTSYESRIDTPALDAGQSATLTFDRGLLVGFTKTWNFSIVVDPDAVHGPVHATQTGVCSDLRSRSEAGMAPLNARYDIASGLWDKTAWWTGANMLEASIDYMRETGDPAYVSLIDNSFTKNQSGNFLNDYYDDEGWWALAWIKAYDFSHQQKYLDMAKTIFQDMTAGWSSECGGGLYWRKERDVKNAIPNELFLTIGARLHQRTMGDSGAGSFLDWATREWAWFKGSGMIGADHQIVDGLDLKTCKASGPAYSYNQGVILGGLADLSQASADATLLDAADDIAHAALSKMVDKNGVFIEAVCDPKPGCGNGDGEQFKGIFARNLGYLYTVRAKPEYQAFLIAQSNSIWNADRSAKNEFGLLWEGPFDTPTSSRQSSALDALNGAIVTANMNLSLHGTATGSAPCNSSQGAANAIDGSSSFGSKWCAGGSDQTLTVDLGVSRYLVGFRLRHAGAGGEDPTWDTRDFEILTSKDGTSYTEVVKVTGNTADVTTHPIPGTDARFARLHITKEQTAPTVLAARIYEFEVFGAGL